MSYAIQVQNRETKNWETQESGDSKSRRKFLKDFDRKKVYKKQWRCVQE